MMDMDNRFSVRAINAEWWNAIHFLIRAGKQIGRVTMEDLKDDGLVYLPSFSLEREQAQVLMDDLWNCGLRPSEGTGSAGSLKATQDHLKDMQKISFDLLERIKKE